MNLHHLLGVLNSRLIGFYIRAASEKAKQRLFPRISLTSVRSLPIAPEHERIAATSSELEQLTTRVAANTTPQEHNVLKRRIAALDREIDRLVYDLYGLTDEEIAIVEEATP